MVREKTCWGVGLICVGVGVLLSMLLGSGLCLFLLAGICVAVGVCLIR